MNPAKKLTYIHLDNPTKDEAMKFVGFDVHRSPIKFTEPNGTVHTSKKETIFRIDGNTPIEMGICSRGYKIVHHTAALAKSFEALDKLGIPYKLTRVSTDQNGSKMYARFELIKKYQITEARLDALNPILTTINGYDGNTGLGFDIESIRLVCMNLASTSMRDVSNRYLHVGDVNPEKLLEVAARSLDTFENKLVPFYKSMAQNEVTKKVAINAVAVAVKDGILPQGLANFAKHCVDSDHAKQEGIKLTPWAMFNAFTWAATKRDSDVSPSRAKEINGKIARLFADGGKDLVAKAEAITEKEVNEIFEKVA
jgi:hypothetical protein